MWKIIETQPDYVIFSQRDDRIRIEAVRGGCFRLTHTRGKAFILANEPIIAHPAAEATLTVSESQDTYLIAAESISAHFCKETGTLSYADGDGMLLTGEPDSSHDLQEMDIVRYRYSDDAKQIERQSVDGTKVIAEGKPYADRKGFSATLTFSIASDEAIYGLGQHEEHILDYKDHDQYLYQHNLKISCPVLVSSRGWGILINSGSYMAYHGGGTECSFVIDALDELDYFVFYGGNPDGCVAVIRSLTGDAPLPPKWAFGYLQSKERYKTQQELIDIAAEYRRRGIPLDAVVQDWFTWPEGLWGQKTVDAERYTDLSAATEALHAIHCRLMWSIWPNMTGDGADRLAFKKGGLLLGNQSTYNAFVPAARALYWQQANNGLFQHGVDAWWCDCSEPFEADWHGETELSAEERMQVNVAEANRYIDPTMSNTYSLYHAQGIYEGQRKTNPDKRVLNLTRSGYPGQQRYGTFVWAGDTSATWDQLKNWIPNALNLCATGIPYWTQDVGAFFVKQWTQWFGRGAYEQGVEDEAYRELYLRWFQASAFLPMLRAHGTDTPREVWRFGKPGSLYYDGLVAMINLRMQLIPYLYSLAADVTFRRGTMLRMLAFDFPQDATARQIADAYMLGHALLVCPVMEPRTETRRVYLPQGADWYDFHTNMFYHGGQWIMADAPLQTVPMYVRAGSVLPIGPVKQYVDEETEQPLILRVYAGADADFTLYDDAGDSYAYEQGAYAELLLHWDDAQGVLTQTPAGDATFLPKNRTTEIIRISR
ncbi:MAG: DUF5110 domain-containing protein [Firmicutes bacterium]|nr:DUF5110 domain-containing protein [Bacillota bacterium]